MNRNMPAIDSPQIPSHRLYFQKKRILKEKVHNIYSNIQIMFQIINIDQDNSIKNNSIKGNNML